jgi:type I site-specific restriction-modification system R (restriction) subunit
VIVREGEAPRQLWMTGFDAPCLHTMYADKTMQDYGLIRAIARVNGVLRDKPGGLVLDYVGLADQLQRTLPTFSESGWARKKRQASSLALSGAATLRRRRKRRGKTGEGD